MGENTSSVSWVSIVLPYFLPTQTPKLCTSTPSMVQYQRKRRHSIFSSSTNLILIPIYTTPIPPSPQLGFYTPHISTTRGQWLISSSLHPVSLYWPPVYLLGLNHRGRRVTTLPLSRRPPIANQEVGQAGRDSNRCSRGVESLIRLTSGSEGLVLLKSR